MRFDLLTRILEDTFLIYIIFYNIIYIEVIGGIIEGGNITPILEE